jgi:hypothetical protein
MERSISKAIKIASMIDEGETNFGPFVSYVTRRELPAFCVRSRRDF